uniref:UDP-glucuronosyltransferase n=1 Tax=Plectus sambesii TaxID=2011161 RepID=A0A914W979_9BILA
MTPFPILIIFFAQFFFVECEEEPLRILQFVPGFTNSHILFNYRLAQTLKNLGHNVSLWTQMEMSMVLSGVSKPPVGVDEFRVDIHFSDSLKTEGLKVFQTMMFNEGTAWDLWWTGQEFKGMRIEACEQMLSVGEDVMTKYRKANFDIMVAHFHDLCPVALANQLNIKKIVWVTHGTSVYDYNAVQMGLRTYPSFVPHPLSSFGDSMTLMERTLNLFWHFSTLDFVNLPQNLLHEENEMYKSYSLEKDTDLWMLTRQVPVLLINGERYLDFPRPLPTGISFMGEITTTKKDAQLSKEFQTLMDKSDKGVIIFSLGTVSNTSNMPEKMTNGFLEAFAQFPQYTILWRLEMDLPGVEKYKHIHVLKWLPQKDLLAHPKMKLLIAHGGYNSLLETAKAGIPALLMPLFADQYINTKRAVRFGIGRMVDKLDITGDSVAAEMRALLEDESYSINSKRLAYMLNDKIVDPLRVLNHQLHLATKTPYFHLKAAQKLNFFQYHSIDVIGCFSTVWLSAMAVILSAIR